MPDDPYTIADLARLAEVTPRTIRYYVAQGLLPSPEGAGPATRYGEGHLARLRLIRRLQRQHQPLAGIRARMERMTDDEVSAALDAASEAPAEPPSDAATTLAYVRSLMSRARVMPRLADEARATPTAPALHVSATPAAAFERPVPDEFPLREAPGPEPSMPPYPPLRPGPEPSSPVVPAIVPIPDAGPDKRPLLADRTTWERVAFTPDVELHVRRPLDRITNKRVERLIRIARELFEDE